MPSSFGRYTEPESNNRSVDNVMPDLTLLALFCCHLKDWLLILFCVIADVILNIIHPFNRYVGSFYIDQWLRFPLKENTIPVWSVPIIAILIPLSVFGGYFVRRKNVRDFHQAVLGMLTAVGVTAVFTDALKDGIGWPRPDFFWRCFPDGVEVSSHTPSSDTSMCVLDFRHCKTGLWGVFLLILLDLWIYPLMEEEFGAFYPCLCRVERISLELIDVFIGINLFLQFFDPVHAGVLCTGDAATIREGYKSFPSGHTSWSFAGLGYLSLYLAGKVTLFDRRGYTSRIFLVFLPLLMAVMVAASRVSDYWHHPQDVIVGGFLAAYPFPHIHGSSTLPLASIGNQVAWGPDTGALPRANGVYDLESA